MQERVGHGPTRTPVTQESTEISSTEWPCACADDAYVAADAMDVDGDVSRAPTRRTRARASAPEFVEGSSTGPGTRVREERRERVLRRLRHSRNRRQDEDEEQTGDGVMDEEQPGDGAMDEDE